MRHPQPVDGLTCQLLIAGTTAEPKMSISPGRELVYPVLMSPIHLQLRAEVGSLPLQMGIVEVPSQHIVLEVGIVTLEVL